MNARPRTKWVALVGGRGAGKTWLAKKPKGVPVESAGFGFTMDQVFPVFADGVFCSPAPFEAASDPTPGARGAGNSRAMSDHPINTLRLRRYTAAQFALGRWLFNLRFHRRRLAWRALGTGARWAKRALDLAGSLALLIAFSPLFALIALLVKLEDGGPVLFAQTRIGRFGREFNMIKFRSMCLGAEERLRELLARNHHTEGVTFKLKDDPRITKIGRWLRRFSLDELPQFFNVLRGEMSLVGPRPPVPREVAMYTLADRRRLAATPGLTCIWQVSGRSGIDFSGQVKLDVQYIERQSFWLDLELLAKTIPAVLSGKGAC
jgi:lipopolysaccharide/colanic/teichoic acid biosynthesis glycosyltransferase